MRHKWRQNVKHVDINTWHVYSFAFFLCSPDFPLGFFRRSYVIDPTLISLNVYIWSLNMYICYYRPQTRVVNYRDNFTNLKGYFGASRKCNLERRFCLLSWIEPSQIDTTMVEQNGDDNWTLFLVYGTAPWFIRTSTKGLLSLSRLILRQDNEGDPHLAH